LSVEIIGWNIFHDFGGLFEKKLFALRKL